MKLIYGIEADYIIEELPEFEKILCDVPHFIERAETIFIFDSLEGAEQARELMQEVGIYIEFHKLILIPSGTLGELYFDYSLASQSDHTYLLHDLVLIFSIVSGTEKGIEMFKYQLEEHLVVKTISDSKEFFFVDESLEPLIRKTAQAYDIEVSFFDLDK
ncbi:hypothetical protein ACFYKX_17945 [Cytobacillus sp. FJAT-54145]|uniref:Uncharacterized protein n=1 Tax=Cytobacillus spartinae TaxID=3299023 RepID=A0ABW6KI03_9BACI